jgi:transcriptional regulator of arginine metabolism
MTTKRQRQAAIRTLLRTAAFGSQAAVRAALAEQGIAAHLATVSRDLEELGTRKVRAADGQLIYTLDDATPSAFGRGLLDDALRRFVESIDLSGNIIVLRTPPACASPVASALDGASEGAILGTVAGDDTVLAVVAAGFDPAEIAADLRRRVGSDFLGPQGELGPEKGEG